MLAYLNGIIQHLFSTKRSLIVVVHDVGYKVHVPASVLAQAVVGQPIQLYLHHVVREDVDDLYGFLRVEDLTIFEQLISVSGVGPKVGLALLSELSADAIVRAITEGDRALLTHVSGVGKKIAERLVLELKTMDIAPTGDGQTQTVVEALQQLGYSSAEVRSVIQQLDHTAHPEQQLKQALAMLSHG